MISHFILINKLANLQRRFFEKISAEEEFSGAELKILHYLLRHKNSDVFQKDLEKEFGIRPPTATDFLKSLAKSGLVRRESLAGDARFKKIVPTEKAELLESQINKATEKLEEQLSENIEEEKLAVWEEVMKKMIENLEEK